MQAREVFLLHRTNSCTSCLTGRSGENPKLLVLTASIEEKERSTTEDRTGGRLTGGSPS